MTDAPRLKKSESLEIRLPHSTKQAFMARCQAQGRSASETLRGFIEDQLAPPPAPRRSRVRYWILGAVVAAFGSIAAPSLARPTVHQQFRAMDADGDRFITTADLVRLDTDGDGRLRVSEFKTAHSDGDQR